MINYRLGNSIKLVLWLAGLLAITSCQKSTNGQASPTTKPTNPVMDISSSPVRTQMDSEVTLRVREHTGGTVTVELKNDTDQPIYVSYALPKQGNKTTFLAYGLERRTTTGGDFKAYGSGFHFVPELNPIAPRTLVVFQVLNLPREKGEYRVLVSYYDKEDVYKLISEKGENLTSNDERIANENRKTARSDAFEVRRDSRG
ncbi:MAG: hypothetical protein AABN95_14705 [Acidobacteriota bacterium]